MIVAIVALLSILLGCAMAIMVQLALVASRIEDLKTHARRDTVWLRQIAENTHLIETEAPESAPTPEPLSDEQVLRGGVMALNDLRRTAKASPKYDVCRSAAAAWVSAIYERLKP